MGFFGGSDSPSRSEELAQEQLELTQQSIEQKRQNLARERLDILKGQGGQIWTPNKMPDQSSSGRGRKSF